MAHINETNYSVGILGTGQFARGLATRCYDHGIDVTVGSRTPTKKRAVPEGDIFTRVKLTTQEQCIRASSIIFIALQPQHHNSLIEFVDLLKSKVVVDISNSTIPSIKSNAQILATFLPDSHIIKAYNTISAHSVKSDFEGSMEVYVCGDDAVAKATIFHLTGRLGLSPIDFGSLDRSLALEARNRQLFPGWGSATVVMGVTFVLWTVLALLRYFSWRQPAYTWERLPTNVFNKICGCCSLTGLCLVYLPGSCAGFTQLCWGTKHRRFNCILASWLNIRKQLGLYALLFGVMHTIMSAVLLSPAYYGKWYLTKMQRIPANRTEDFTVSLSSRMNVVGEVCVFLGVLAICCMSILGITSLPSLARSLTQREWRFVQSHLGFGCLCLATSHLTVKWATSWTPGDPYMTYLPTVTFFALPLPWFTILLRLVLYMPCVYAHLGRIQAGWERQGGTAKSDEHLDAVKVEEPAPNSTGELEMRI